MSNGIFKFVQINMKHLLYMYGITPIPLTFGTCKKLFTCQAKVERNLQYMLISLPAEPKLHGNYSHFVSYGARLFAENPFVEYDCTSKTTHCGTQANNVDPDQGLYCLLTGCYI